MKFILTSGRSILVCVVLFALMISGCQSVPGICHLQGLKLIDARLLPKFEQRSLFEFTSPELNGAFFLLYQQQDNKVDALLMSLEGAELLEFSLKDDTLSTIGLLKDKIPADYLFRIIELAFFPEQNLQQSYKQQFRVSQEGSLRAFYVCNKLQAQVRQQQDVRVVEMQQQGISVRISPLED